MQVVTLSEMADDYEYQKGKSPPYRDGSATPEKNPKGACNQGGSFSFLLCLVGGNSAPFVNFF